MQMQRFLDAYGEHRNGSDFMVRHPLVRNFIYSSGVQECAEAGLYWLIDILATEAVPHMRNLSEGGNFLIVYFDVKAGQATVRGATSDVDPAEWERQVDWTDCEDGSWQLYIQYDGQYYTCILPSEY